MDAGRAPRLHGPLSVSSCPLHGTAAPRTAGRQTGALGDSYAHREPLGFDHRIGHFRPLRIIGTTPNSSALNGLGASTWDRSRWGGRRHDQGHHDNALEAVQRALAIATALEDFDLKVAVWHYMGVIAHALGDYRRAIEVLGWNVAALR